VPSDRQCAHVKPGGARCQARPVAGSDLCFFHDPATAEKRAEARKKGGQTRNKPAATLPPETADLELESVPDVVRLLGRTINDVRKGVVDAKVANAVGYLGSVLLRALEGSELTGQVAELREQLEAIKNERGNPPSAGGADAGGVVGPDGGGEPAAAGATAGPGEGPDGGGDRGPLAAAARVLPLFADSAVCDPARG
jgi:hypothetical protein